MQLFHRLGTGLLAGSLLVGGAGGALAAGGAKTRVQVTFAAGQVSNLSATGFTLTAAPATTAGSAATPQSVQVALTATTREKARKGTTGSLANGEYAVVIGAKTATGITARRLVYSATAFTAKQLQGVAKAARSLRRHGAVGTVSLASTGATALTLTTKAGKTLTFVISSATKYRVDGKPVTTAPSFTNGERVRVIFKRDKATKSLVARVISVRTTTAPQP